jgi:D-sedoheptulose 7-phosphate isomerase
MKEFAKNYLQQVKDCIDALDLSMLEKIKDIIVAASKKGKRIFICGNGGSASTASHFACDLGKGSIKDFNDLKENRIKVLALTDNLATITAYANDNGYETIFKEQLQNLVEEGDVVIGISASGNSPNIVKALEFAKKKKAITVGFVGFLGGKVKEVADHSLHIKNNHYGVVEDLHLIIQHIISYFIKDLRKNG